MSLKGGKIYYVASYLLLLVMFVTLCVEGLAPKENWPQTNPLAHGVLKQVTYPVTDGLCCAALSNIVSQRERRVPVHSDRILRKNTGVLMAVRVNERQGVWWGDKKGEDDGVSVWNRKRSHTASLELFLVFWGAGRGAKNMTHHISCTCTEQRRTSFVPPGVTGSCWWQH